jgi:hypothetical protein
MKRAERLHAMSEMLRRRGAHGYTADRLAREFAVSARTVKRDLAALANSGAAVWSRPGPGGGYGLIAGPTLPPVTLSSSQATALLAAVAAAPDAPYADQAAAGVQKILDVLDPVARDRIKERRAGSNACGAVRARGRHDNSAGTPGAVPLRRRRSDSPRHRTHPVRVHQWTVVSRRLVPASGRDPLVHSHPRGTCKRHRSVLHRAHTRGSRCASRACTTRSRSGVRSTRKGTALLPTARAFPVSGSRSAIGHGSEPIDRAQSVPQEP